MTVEAEEDGERHNGAGRNKKRQEIVVEPPKPYGDMVPEEEEEEEEEEEDILKQESLHFENKLKRATLDQLLIYPKKIVKNAKLLKLMK